MFDLNKTNRVIEDFEKVLKAPRLDAKGPLYCGVDLGTAFIVIAVVDDKGQPVAGAYQYASVVKDGMVVDYIGACDIVRKLKEDLEKSLGQELIYAACAIPPGTERTDGGAVKNVCESAGFEIVKVIDEASAANVLIGLDKGAVVDIGGGTTGIALIKDSKVVEVYDEATGGTHFSLVISGAKKISFDEAELYKRDDKNHKEILPIVGPVIDKISSIIERSIKGHEVDEVILVGGTACLTGMEDRIQKKLQINTHKPEDPMFVTPMGIALACMNEKEGTDGRH